MNTEARQEMIDAGCDALCQMNEAYNILWKTLPKMRENALTGSGYVSNAMNQIGMAMDALADLMKQMGALE